MQRSTILWVSHFIPFPPKGGALQRSHGLITELAKLREVHLLCMQQPRLMQQVMGAADTEQISIALNELGKSVASVDWLPIPSERSGLSRRACAVAALLSGMSFTERWLRSAELLARVSKAVRRLRPSVVHLDTISLASLSCVVGHTARVSLGHHNIESHMMWRRAERERNALARAYFRTEAARLEALERRYVSTVDVNIVCSDLDAHRLASLSASPLRIAVAENGVRRIEWNHRREGFPNNPGHPRFVFVGRMSAYTNSAAAKSLVSDVWPRIANALPNATLDIIGASPPVSALRLASTDSRVTVHGFVSDLSAVAHPGMIFLCPIRDGGGTKLKILDAMSRGWPIVADPVALEGINGLDGIHWRSSRTALDMAASAVNLARDPKAAYGMALNAVDLVERRYLYAAIARSLAETLDGHQLSTSVTGLPDWTAR